MSTTVSKITGIILLMGSVTLYGHKAVPSIVSASHVVRHGDEVRETRVHLMHDHKLYVEDITQQLSSPTCRMSLAVIPEDAFQRIKNLMGSSQFPAIQNRQQPEMKPGQDEIWHIAFRDGPTRFFTFSPPQSRPPASFVAWFEEAQRVQPHEDIELKPDTYRCTLFSQEMSNAWQH